MVTDVQYTVKQLAVIAGVSARTLHYYDEIGLLQPRRNPANGYRLYDRAAVLCLQQILFLRELGFSLETVKSVMDGPDFDLLAALEQHRVELQERQKKLSLLLDTVERTILNLKGKIEMEPKEYFAGFSEERQKEYEEEARRRYGDKEVNESRKRWGSYSEEKKGEIMKEGNAIYLDLAAAMPHGPASPQAQEGIGRWHKHLQYFYEPTREILLGLGDLYNEDPAFNATFHKIHPELAAFMREAIREYCKGLE